MGAKDVSREHSVEGAMQKKFVSDCFPVHEWRWPVQLRTELADEGSSFKVLPPHEYKK